MKKSLVRYASFALAALAFATVSTVSAASHDSLQPLADTHAKALPVTTSFEKAPAGQHGGTHALKVKNTGEAPLAITATVRWSIISHGSEKTTELPAHTVAAGEVWTIDDLSAEDKVSLAASGFETLEVKVPASK